MNIDQYAEVLLFKGTIEDKLLPPKVVTSFSTFLIKDIPVLPTREEKIKISSERVPFPKNLTDSKQKAKALHFFANHELLAIEMMAAALVRFELDELTQKRILATIADEQKHFLLYCNRMKDFGNSFGDYPVNDFFWRQIVKVDSFESFYAVVALTLEQANLDFARFYSDRFKQMGDLETSKIFEIVLTDEEKHVHFGVEYLNMKLESQEELWDYYRDLLPNNFTPARAKGMTFNYESRVKAGLPESFIDTMKDYKDDYKIVNRKQWKSE